MELEELRVVIRAETGDLRRQLNQLTSQVRQTNNAVNNGTSNMRRSLKGLVKKIGFAYLTKELISFGQSCIKLGSDLQEVQNVVDVVFSSMTSQVDKFAKSAAQNFGLSETMAKKYIGLYGSMAESFGFTESEAYKMSSALTGLAGDVASFYNITQDEAYTKLKSVFSGETETLKDLGVVMTQAALDQYALANGYGKTTDEMSEQEKVALRYKFVMDQLSNAQGDFARTSDSWANQVRLLKLQFDSLKATIGQGLIIAITPVIKGLNVLIGKLQIAAQAFNSFISGLFGKKIASVGKDASKGLSSIASGAGTASNGIDNVGKSAKKTAKEVKNLMGFDEINSLNKDDGSSDDSSSSGAGGGGIDGGVYDSMLGDLDDSTETTASKFEEMGKRVRKAIKSITDFIKKHKAIIIAIFAGLVTFILGLFVISKWGAITALIGTILETISLIPTAIGVAFLAITSPAVLIAAAIGVVVAALVYLWQTSDSFRSSIIEGWKALVDALTPYIEAIKNLFLLIVDILVTVLKPVIMTLWDVICTVVENVVKIVMSFWTNVLAPIVKFFGECVLIVVNGLAEIWAYWKPTIEKIQTVFMAVWDKCLKPFVNWIGKVFIVAFKNIGNLIKPILENMKRMFSGLINFIVGVFTGNWRKAWNGVKDVFASIFSGLVGLAKAPINAVIACVNGLISGVNACISGLNKISVDVPDWVPGIGGKKFGFNLSALGTIPYLAKGGIINSPTLAMVGEAGREAVVPLENNTGWMDKMAGIIGSTLLQVLQVSNSGNNSSMKGDLYFDKTKVGQVLYESIERERTRRGQIYAR